MIDIIFTGAVLKTSHHLLLDLNKLEKEHLNVRTDINLPEKIKEAIDENGQKAGEDTKITIIDLSLGQGYQRVQKNVPKKRGGFFSNFFRCGQKDEQNQEI
jgi:hypothetical protein